MIKLIQSIITGLAAAALVITYIFLYFKGNGYLTNIFYTKKIFFLIKMLYVLLLPAVVNVYNQALHLQPITTSHKLITWVPVLLCQKMVIY